MSFKFFKCFVLLQAIWWPDFIKFRSCTPEIQGHDNLGPFGPIVSGNFKNT